MKELAGTERYCQVELWYGNFCELHTGNLALGRNSVT
jgi:hypothetical protein